MNDSVLNRIYNYRAVDESLATSGQPSAAQLGEIARAGFTTVINLALHDDPRYSLPDERGTVQELGLNYVHIPVQFSAPVESDLLEFFDAMRAYPDEKVWVHCAANMRVSAFVGLYRVIVQDWDPAKGFQLMHGLWRPDAIWADFIAAMISKHRRSHTPPALPGSTEAG